MNMKSIMYSLIAGFFVLTATMANAANEPIGGRSEVYRSNHELTLSVMTGTFALLKFDNQVDIPSWLSINSTKYQFVSITKTNEELSIVCDQSLIPPTAKIESIVKDWRALKAAGPEGSLDVSLIGILSTLTQPLAEAKLNIFAISTYNTDYIFVKAKDLARAIEALRKSGIKVINN